MTRAWKPSCWWLLLVVSLGVGCAGPPRGISTGQDAVQRGKASYYHDSLHGNPTASGTPYDRNALTAAHRQLAFGTRIRVRNLENGRSVTLTVNDRGPFVAGRIVDVSYRGAVELDMVRAGAVDVTLEILD